MSEQESLQLIRSMIDRGRHNFKAQSIFYLLWGWAVLVAGLTQYVLLSFTDYEKHWLVWPVLMVATAITSAFIGRSQSKKQRYVSFVEGSIRYLWGGFVLYLLMVLFISKQIGWGSSYILIIGLYGLATFVSGGILRFAPLIVGGLLSILLGFAGVFAGDFFAHFPNVLLALCLSIVVSYLIPGYMLRKKAPDAA